MIELPPRALGLNNQELRFLETLLNAQGFVTHAAMTEAISHRDPDESRISQVICCKTKKKLAAVFEDSPIIETVWGRGYRLAEGARDLIFQAVGFDLAEAA